MQAAQKMQPAQQLPPQRDPRPLTWDGRRVDYVGQCTNAYLKEFQMANHHPSAPVFCADCIKFNGRIKRNSCIDLNYCLGYDKTQAALIRQWEDTNNCVSPVRYPVRSNFESNPYELRISQRIAKGSWKRLQIDDYIMCFTAITYTGAMVSINQVGWVNSRPEVHADEITPHAQELLIWGNKMCFAMEQFCTATTWLVKCCLLIIYSRLTYLLKEHTIVQIVAIYVGLSYILIEILLCAVWCQPIEAYWAPNVNDDFQCSTYFNHMIVSAVFNISSDLVMLCIPLPLFIRSHLRLGKKLAVCGVFGLGFVVILMAILNRYYSLSTVGSMVFMRWYAAEISTAVYVANLPLMWPLIRVVFHLQTPNPSSYPERGQATPRSAPQRARAAIRNITAFTTHQGSSVESIIRDTDGQMHGTVDAHELSLTTAGERDRRASIKPDVELGQRQRRLEDITVQRTVEVTYQ
ncbi:hypothetical protein P875_00076281 [Aspergillus parasiticus SU-1]|uniref:Rhodopsin domain-containing protein n=1 Tax=Aspergillus parasiticus (strain ATCC 56775 / NRRL 5862 / SRRC 143 / SU-1) TaxID=1403190 RepID=A0A0F0IKN7_ASPPU|nr:hypothetical protein P875_00076281 [Aspergillus parasiticus SU-1]